MIKPSTIDRIMHAARIEDVVGDYVKLSKRGVNLLGLCPFHNEKTPSFTVTAVKGIYKCFGCGKAGNSVGFLMEHENMSYPEALRALAGKYGIEIEEDSEVNKEEAAAEAKERDSLLVALDWSAKLFNEQLIKHEEGINIGLSYFEERGFRQDTIAKFGLGYCLDQWSAFHDKAIEAGYKETYLERAGLIKKKDDGKYFDFFKGRVMFPIHNLGGKVIGFGGRVLQKDAKAAKYLNSPESEVYHKSDTLYGIYQAKKKIQQERNCYLVEGYTDVITLHQAGVENVVASSGTSLTEGQIRLLKRFTEDVTVLYDGDWAGIKASLRGTDMLLADGLNVRVVLFPDGEDPDSYCKKVGGEAFEKYIQEQAEDFIRFKTNLLLKDTGDDPVKKADVMRQVAESVAKIPDNLTREVYIRECARLFGYGEELFSKEIASIRRKEQIKKDDDRRYQPQQEAVKTGTPAVPAIEGDEFQERDLIRVLFEFGNQEVDGVKGLNYIIDDLKNSQIEPETPLYNKLYKEFVQLYDRSAEVDDVYFINHPDMEISQAAIGIITSRYELSPHWVERYEIYIRPRLSRMKEDILSAINRLKIKKLDTMLEGLKKNIQSTTDETQIDDDMLLMQHFLEMRHLLSRNTGTVIVR
jgi:DNA primase